MSFSQPTFYLNLLPTLPQTPMRRDPREHLELNNGKQKQS